MLKNFQKLISLFTTLALLSHSTGYSQTRDLGGTGKLLDGVAAIVNDGVVLRSELNEQLNAIIANLENQQGQLPPRNVIESQVLERLIIKQIQLQRAERLGIRIPDEVLNSAITNVADKNNVSFSDFPEVLAEEGISYDAYRQELREQLTIDQLRQRDVASRINVSPSELESFLIMMVGFSIFNKLDIKFSLHKQSSTFRKK